MKAWLTAMATVCGEPRKPARDSAALAKTPPERSDASLKHHKLGASHFSHSATVSPRRRA